MADHDPVIAITPGEPSGIGPEILLKLKQQHPQFKLLAVADPRLLRQAADSLGFDTRITKWQPGEPFSTDQLSCLPTVLAKKAKSGQPTMENVPYVLESLRQAAHLAQQGHAAAMVTGPVHKGIINDAGIPFTGHTEFLADQCGAGLPVMLLAAGDLRIALATTHLPLKDVPAAITGERLKAVIQVLLDDLRRYFGIADPEIVVCGLNPHAGEGGHLGLEDDAVIRPVINELSRQGMRLRGPLPADTAFTPAAGNKDAVLAMYHDQGLPVLKYAGFGHAVNVTLGLPIIRTSVDHGTAFDIAGSGTADSGSLIAAIELAKTMASN